MDNTAKQLPTPDQQPTTTPQPPQSPRQTKPARGGKWIGFLAAALVVGAVAGFGGAWAFQALPGSGAPTPFSALESGEDGNKIISQDEAGTAELAKKAAPSIVSIVTNQTQDSLYGTRQYEGAGTGMVVSKDGYILTNKHVVSSANTIRIIASDGTEYRDVTKVGEDPLNDVAFLKIRDLKQELQPVQLGDSGSTRVGQRVIAIGNSLGQYQNSVTSGIISGKGRPVTAASSQSSRQTASLTDLIQTDAAINPGNSGGPLFNTSGQVIGMNTAIVSDAQSIGFAIPINAVKGLLKGVLQDGTIKKAYLGVGYVNITPEVAAASKLDQKAGAYIKSTERNRSAIQEGGPADRAGLKDEDIITKVNGKVVGEAGGLASLVAEYLPGDEVELTIVRDGQQLTKKITLGRYRS